MNAFLFSKAPTWVDSGNSQVFSWHYTSLSARGNVLLIPPHGHEAFHSHRFYCRLAERIANEGFDIIRFDLPGTGNSSGSMQDDALYESWVESIGACARQFHDLTKPTTLIGLRLGANLAASAQNKFALASHIIAIEPIWLGKRLAREIKATAAVSASNIHSSDVDDTTFIEAGGFSYSIELLEDITSQNFEPEHNSTPTTVFLESKKKQSHIQALQLDHIVALPLTELAGILAEPQYTETPIQLIKEIVSVLSSRCDKPTAPSNNIPLIRNQLEGAWFYERTITDPLGQFGIITQPHKCTSNKVVVFINSGSGPHTGPNRVYVEQCRKLASAGCIAVRFDLKNLGDSSDSAIVEENHCYPQSATAYCHSMVTTLAESFPNAELTLAGICSGAHHAFHYSLSAIPAVKQVLIINPLTFYWKSGMSLETPVNSKTTIDANYYSKAISNPKSWLKLLSGKASMTYIFTFLLKLIVKKARSQIKSVREIFTPVPNTQFNRDIAQLVNNGIDVYFIIASNDPGWGLIADASELTKAKFLTRLEVHGTTIAEAGHTFSSKAAKAGLSQGLMTALKLTPNDSQNDVNTKVLEEAVS